MAKDRKRGPLAVLVIPLLVAVAAASRAGGHVRTVDFLQIFAAGMIFGVLLTRFFQLIFEKKKTEA